tara:strand:+ start:10298 stop:12118 length:1821 start_codon:yes stop_codon:yes gene_type:complete
MAEQRDIKYVNREFGDFREQLVEFAKSYFPDSYNDFNETAPGMMFIEMASYVGDVLSFYQDTQLQETFLQHAQNPSNLYSLAYMMGYRPRVSTAAEVGLKIEQKVQALSGSNYVPDWDQAIKVHENSTIKSTAEGNTSFILQESVDFKFSSSYDPTDISIASVDEDNNPAEYLLTKSALAISGEIKSTESTFTTAEKFATINITDDNILKVLDVTDSDGNTWTEVPFLGQDTIFDEEQNAANDSSLVPSILKLKRVPRRFVTRFTSKGVMQIQFGSGVVGSDDETFLPDPSNIKKYGDKQAVEQIDRAFDPTNFLFTRTYGLAPSNTTLTIRYLTGGGVGANAPANSVTSGDVVTTTVTDSTFLTTLTFNNEKPASGGKDGDTVEELRQNSLKAFSEQKRAVTTSDYTVRALSLPPQFGSVAKAFVTKEFNQNTTKSVLSENPLALALYVLAYDNDGKLITATNSLKNNLKSYLTEYMMITDAIDIKDAFIVNIGVKFEVLTLPNYASRDVLLNCTNKLKDYFKTSKRDINQPINISSVYTVLDQIKGVQTVKSVTINNKAGGNYSQFAYDVEGATKGGIVYPSYDPCIFEVKYPNIDIEGRVTTI